MYVYALHYITIFIFCFLKCNTDKKEKERNLALVGFLVLFFGSSSIAPCWFLYKTWFQIYFLHYISLIIDLKIIKIIISASCTHICFNNSFFLYFVFYFFFVDAAAFVRRILSSFVVTSNAHIKMRVNLQSNRQPLIFVLFIYFLCYCKLNVKLCTFSGSQNINFVQMQKEAK